MGKSSYNRKAVKISRILHFSGWGRVLDEGPWEILEGKDIRSRGKVATTKQPDDPGGEVWRLRHTGRGHVSSIPQ